MINNLKVLYEDNHIIVVLKPANVLSQEDSTKDLNMLNMVKAYIKEKYRNGSYRSFLSELCYQWAKEIPLSEILTKKFDGHEQVRGTWYHFSPDITMRCIERLFKKYYEIDNLNGVIRVFNLCNVINANYKGLLVELKKCEVDSSLAYTTDFDVENITAPTYIGWGQAWKKDFKERCKPYFKKACEEEYTILDDDIKSNPFYHPLYLMNYGGPKTKCIVDKFVKKD